MAAAAGGATVGARIVLAGVDDFLGGIGAIGSVLGSFASDTGGLGKTNERLAETTKGFSLFNAGLQSTQAALGAVAGTVSTITAPIRTIGGAVTDAASEVIDGSGKIVGALGDVGKSLADLSEKGALGVGAVGGSIAALATTAVTESAKFQRGMIDIAAVAQVPPPELELLDNAIRRVAANFPAAVGNIQRSALELAKAGVDIGSIKTTVLDLTVAAEQLSGGELTSEQAAETIGSNLKLFSRSFQAAGNDAEQASARIINAIVAVANRTRASIPEVVSAINKFGPNVVPLGGNIEQTAALAGAVVAQGPRGQEAGTALANFVQRLEHPSAGASKVLDTRNISLFDVVGKARPVIDVIKDIQDTYGEAGRAVNGLTEAQAFNELAEIAQTRVLRTLNLIVETGVGDYKDFLAEIARTDVIAQANQQNTALIRQLEILRNNAVLAGVAFGRDFVEGLGSGTTALNAFLTDGERAQQLAGAIGKGTAAVLTGQGDENARAAIHDNPDLGDEGTKIFDSFNSGAETTRQNVGKLFGDVSTLAANLGGITFPDGISGAVDAASAGLNTVITTADGVVQKFNEITPIIVDDLQQITGAATFDELIDNAKSFGNEILKIFSNDNGEQSFKRAQDAGVGFLKTVREEAGPTILEIAKLARTVEDNLPAFIKLADVGVRVFGTITRAAAGFLGILTNIAGAIAGDITGPLDFIGAIPGAVAGGIKTDFTTVSDTEFKAAGRAAFNARNGLNPDGSPNRDTTVGGNADPFIGPLASQASTLQSNAELAQTASALAAENGTVATSADDAAAAQKRLSQEALDAANAVGATSGDFRDYAKEARDAAAAQTAFEQSVKSLDSSQRTLTKDTQDVQGAFDKTVQGARERWLDGMDQIAQSTSDTVSRIRRTASEARDKALEGFNIQTARGGGFAASLDDNGQLQVDLSTSVAGINTIFQRFQQDQKLIFSHGQEDRATLRHQFAENDANDASRAGQDLERIESQVQEALTRERQRGLEDREKIRQREEQDAATAFTRGQDVQLTAFTRGQDAQNTARLRAREDQRASQKLAKDLGAATPEDRTKILAAFTEDRRSLALQRQDQNDDTKYAQTQQDQLTKFKQTQEEAATKFRRDQEDVDISHRRDLELQDVSFRRQLEIDLVVFRRQLEDRESQRRRIAATLEVTQQRRDALEAQGFDRGQGDQATLFNALNEKIPDLQRQLREIDKQQTDQITTAGQSAAREILRTSLTAQRGITAGQATSEEALRRLQERFNINAANLLERAPESKRPELQGEIDKAQAVLSAQITLARARNQGAGGTFNGEIDQATQTAISQLAGIVPDLSSIQQVFGGDASSNLVTTSLLASPQVDRLTRALENLTTKIDQVKPGINVDTVQQTIVNPQPGGAITPTIGLGTIAGVL